MFFLKGMSAFLVAFLLSFAGGVNLAMAQSNVEPQRVSTAAASALAEILVGKKGKKKVENHLLHHK